MGSMHLRALRNGAVAAVVTAVVGFTLNALVSPEGTTRASGSPTPSAPSSPACKPRTDPLGRTAVRGLGGTFEDLWFGAPNDGWAVGGVGDEAASTPVLARWNGETWTEDPGAAGLGGTAALAAIEGSDPVHAWAVGWTGDGLGRDTLAAHFDGTSWTVTTSPSDGELADVRVLSDDDVWAVGWLGDPDFVQERATALHWDGTSWTQLPVQAGGGRSGLRAIAGGRNDLWAAGYHHRGPLLMHFDGTRWQRVDVEADGPLSAVAARNGTVWLAGPSLLRGDGSSFTEVATPPEGGAFADLGVLSDDAVVVVGSVSKGARSRSIALDVVGEDARAAPLRARGDDALAAVAVVRDGVWLAGWRDTPGGAIPFVASFSGC